MIKFIFFSSKGSPTESINKFKEKKPDIYLGEIIVQEGSSLNPFIFFPYTSLPEGITEDDLRRNLLERLNLCGFIEGSTNINEKVIKMTEKSQEENLCFNTPDKIMQLGGLVDQRFYQPRLLSDIYLELDKDHKVDHLEKMGVFLICLTAELKDPKDHCSCALKGNSAVGKDNVILTAFKHFPQNESFFLTSGTKAAIEDEIGRVKRIAFSEINKNRENGANSELTELFKQMAEGGLNSLKKDQLSGFKTTRHIQQEQKTLLYGTTESTNDDELETRYVVIPIQSSFEKNQIVVNDSLKKARDEEYILQKIRQPKSWIAESIRNLDHNLEINIPFTEVFENPIKDEDGVEKHLFDFAKDRIKRDTKRILSITKGIAWLYQKQRRIVEKEGVKILYAEPSDFLTAIKIFAGFFNFTYIGLDHRLIRTYDQLKALMGNNKEEIKQLGFSESYSDWVLRNKLQDALNIENTGTIKNHIKKLVNVGRVETHYNKETNQKAVLIRPINRPINDLSIPVSLIAIDRSLTGWLIGNNLYKKDINAIDLGIMPEFEAKSKHIYEKLTGQKLTGQLKGKILTPEFLNIVSEYGREGVTYTDLKQKTGLTDDELNDKLAFYASRGHIFETPKDVWKIVYAVEEVL